MLKRIFVLLIIAIIFCGLPKHAVASHVSGAEIIYTALGGNQYKVSLINYWDCSAFDPGVSLSITANNTCGLASINFSVNLDTAYEISQVCPTATTTCSGGTITGMKKNVYSATITLSGACSQWTFEHNSCCRNTAINVTTQPSYTFYATLNNAVAPDNNSPYFTSQPLPYMCVGQPVCYSPGVVELDGNTLSFSFVDAMDANSTTPVIYAGGYSGTSPMPGISINPTTGLISFTPTMVGNFVVAYMVTEKDANGIIIGTVIRDIQMVVVSCTNQVIPCNSGGIFNLTGTGATVTGPNSMQICENIPFSFQMSFTDPDAANVLSFTSNISQVLPGSIISSTGSNPILINVSWMAPPNSAGWNTTFALTISDNACPVTGQQTVNYIINVLAATSAGSDQIKCGNQSIQLNGVGPGTIFNWSVISGPPLVVGTNFSCNPCQDPIASPTSTTTYLLTCNGGNGCLVTDTITVNVVPDFNYNITQSAASSCLLQPIQLGIMNLSPSGPGFSYQWSPSVFLNNDTIINPTATITSPGTYSYSVTITNPFGCIKKDSLTLSVIPAVTPIITAHADTSFCAGSTALLGITFGNGVPPSCGLSATGGCTGSIPVTVGTGTLTTNQYSTPYTGYWDNGRMQTLYTAAELNALGFVGGKITSIALDVAQKSSTQPYSGFTIKMGCTNLSSLPNTSFQTVPTLVYGPVAVSTTIGWNTYNFATAYEWDGISNLIVEMCYSNLTWTGNDVLNKSVTAFFSVINDYEDTNPGCSLPSPDTFISQTERPNTRFTTCAVSANPANYSYQWVPASGNIANPIIQNTTAQPNQTTTFTVTVTDIVGGCSSTDSVQVDVVNINSLTITPQPLPYCLNGGIDTLQVSVPLGSGVWTGPGIIDATLGVFDPSVALIGPIHTIYYTVTGSCGTAVDSINLVVSVQPDATITSIVPPQCSANPPVSLSAATPGGVWSGPGIPANGTGIFDPAVAGIGSHIITYAINIPCPTSDTLLINVIPFFDATITNAPTQRCIDALDETLSSVTTGGIWSGAGIIDPIVGIFSPAAAGAGSHLITHVFTGACGNSATATINVIALPTISFTSSLTEACLTQPITFTGVGNPASGVFSWDFDDPGSGANNTSNMQIVSHPFSMADSFFVSLTYSISPGCYSYYSDTVIIYTPLDASIASHPPTICSNDPTITFTNLFDAGGIWSGSGIVDPIAGIFDPSTATIGSNTISYTLPGLCGDQESTVITVVDKPVITYSVDTNQGCEPKMITFTAIHVSPASNVLGESYLWNFDDPESGGSNTSTIEAPSHNFETKGNYDVTLTYTIPPGCIADFDSTMYVHSQPIASFITSPQPTDIINPEVHFIDYSSGQIDNWTWIIDTLGTLSGQNPHAWVFTDSGTFADTLIVSNIFGCNDTIPGTITIDGILTFYAPNAFTPDGNGRNDVFRIQGEGIDYSNFEMTVYDRWGTLVYKSTDLYEGWNGKFLNKGTIQEVGVYVWKVYLKDFQHSKHYYMGHITLLK